MCSVDRREERDSCTDGLRPKGLTEDRAGAVGTAWGRDANSPCGNRPANREQAKGTYFQPGPSTPERKRVSSCRVCLGRDSKAAGERESFAVDKEEVLGVPLPEGVTWGSWRQAPKKHSVLGAG